MSEPDMIDTALCWLGISKKYTEVKTKRNGETVEVCVANDQLDNVVNTASNAGQARYFSSAAGGAAAAGTAALQGGAAGLDYVRSQLLMDYNHFMATDGEHRLPKRGIGICANKIDWAQYPDFETALKAEGKKCFGQ